MRTPRITFALSDLLCATRVTAASDAYMDFGDAVDRALDHARTWGRK